MLPRAPGLAPRAGGSIDRDESSKAQPRTSSEIGLFTSMVPLALGDVLDQREVDPCCCVPASRLRFAARAMRFGRSARDPFGLIPAAIVDDDG
jgi:hypothetical protein